MQAAPIPGGSPTVSFGNRSRHAGGKQQPQEGAKGTNIVKIETYFGSERAAYYLSKSGSSSGSIREALRQEGIIESCGFLRRGNTMAMASDELVNALADEDSHGVAGFVQAIENIISPDSPTAYNMLQGMEPTQWIPIDRWDEFCQQSRQAREGTSDKR